MSLLVTSKTNSDNLKFFTKMEEYFNKRTASVGQHSRKTKPKQKKQQLSTKIPLECLQELKQMMNDFMKNVQGLITKFQVIDHYYVLDVLRKHQFFSDVAIHISSDLLEKVKMLEREVFQKSQTINGLKKDLKFKQLFSDKKTSKPEEDQPQNAMHFNSSKSMASNIYFHARASTQTQFIEYYNKVTLANGITLKKIQLPSQVKEHKDLPAVVSELMVYSKGHNNSEKIEELIDMIKELIDKKQCKRHCCQDLNEKPDDRENKAKAVMSSMRIRDPKNNYYKNDKSEEYFERYYRGDSFNISNITSVQRTKLQEMQRIQVQYKKQVKRRKKLQNRHRYTNSFTHQI